MLARVLKAPQNSILLLGPRGTGKSTWIRQNFSKAPYYDLLGNREFLRLSRDPSLLYDELSHLKKNTWVVLDEIQRIPELLNEVQRLMEEKKIRFVLSGSSARKLKKSGANLLAGRARKRFFYPLVSSELKKPLSFPQCLKDGMLPVARLGSDPEDYLRSYVETYLQEEIKEEALTRSLGSFSRFLEVAARQNGQVTNVSAIARDAQVARQTVQGYFEILEDTLVGFWLRPWKLRSATKQVSHPKFYFFDSGVVRALSGRLPYPPSPEEQGSLLETFLLNEMRAYLSYRAKHYPLHYWQSRSGVEVDVVCETKGAFVGLEIKSSTRWDSRYNRGLKTLREEISNKPVKAYGVFLGPRERSLGEIRLLPVKKFLQLLWQDKIL